MKESSQKIINQFCDILKENTENTLSIIQISGSLIKLTSEKLPFSIYIYGKNEEKRFLTDEKKSIHIDIEILKLKFEIIINRILSISFNQKKVYARQTVVARVDKKNTILFLEENHLQGAMPGKYRYGLFLDGELVSLAVFSGGRRLSEKNDNEYRSFELIRFCNKLGYNVVGGISKLLKAFINDFSPGDIMTYTDKDWSQESSLEKIGFIKKSETDPLRYWNTDLDRILIRDEEQYKHLIIEQSNGYLKENMGSLKMILPIK